MKTVRNTLMLMILLAVLTVTAFGQETPVATPPATPAAGDTHPTTRERGPFELDPAPTAPESPGQPVDPEKTMVSIAFAKADLVNVLGFLSMASGIPIIVDADVKGTVTISSMKKVPLSLAYEAINSALRVRGYTMVGTLQDRMIRVVTLKKAIADRAVVQLGADPAQIGTSDAIITQVIPLTNISAVRLREELRPLVADDQANLLAVSSTNTMIVTDTEGNVKRLVQIINLLDKDTSSDVLDVAVYKCEYASAPVLIDTLERTFGLGNYAARTATGARPNQPQQGRQPNQQANAPTIRTDEGLMTLKGEIRIAADDRTNSIIISASKEKIDVVLGLVKKLDINTTSEVRARIFRLQYADANLVANQLNTLFEQPQGGITSRAGFSFFRGSQPSAAASANDYAGLKRNIIVADVRTNSVVVTATEQNLKEFEALIKELDAPNVLSDIAQSYQLKYAKATTMASTLNTLFRGNTRNQNFFRDLLTGNASGQGDPIASLRNITVVAEDKTNILLITGPPQAFPMIQGLIEKLDRRTPQVFIQVAIVDVTLDDSTKFGVEWTWSNDPHGANKDSVVHKIGPGMGLSDEKLGLKYSVISSNLQALLHALQTRSNVRVYSTPSITTADNVPARISIGQDVPFVSSSEETNNGNLRQTVAFKNVSITLNVTPHVTEASNLIALDVQQTINELIGREVELNAPIIANREARTTVMVNDGQTIVIGGIIKENTEQAKKAVPLLSKLPLVGELFTSRTNTTTKSELMVFLTPRILRDEHNVDEMTNQQQQRLSDPVKLPTSLGVVEKP